MQLGSTIGFFNGLENPLTILQKRMNMVFKTHVYCAPMQFERPEKDVVITVPVPGTDNVCKVAFNQCYRVLNAKQSRYQYF